MVFLMAVGLQTSVLAWASAICMVIVAGVECGVEQTTVGRGTHVGNMLEIDAEAREDNDIVRSFFLVFDHVLG